MASQDTNNTHSSIISTGRYNREDDDDDGLLHNLSRLSICTGKNALLKQSSEQVPPSTGDGGGHDQDMGLYMSRLNITEEDSDGGDADEELSDYKEDGNKGLLHLTMSVLSSDSDKEAGCLSLPSTPPRLRRHQQHRHGSTFLNQSLGVKEYASENEAHNKDENKMRRNWRRRSALNRAERWFEKTSSNYNDRDKKKNKKKDDDDGHGSGSGNSCIVITRPKGGQRALYMDLGEVKACEDLGFELEHERMLEIPIASNNINNRVVVSMSAAASTIDTASSGGNSPIANLRISSPGDDPKDVKARIKMWAQAVASSTSPRRGFFQ